MDKSKLKEANKLLDERWSIEKELRTWENDIKHKGKLAYIWGDNLPSKLESNISDELFSGIRVFIINELKLKINEIDKKFEQL